MSQIYNPQYGVKRYAPDYVPREEVISNAVLNPLEDGTVISATLGKTTVVGEIRASESNVKYGYITVELDGVDKGLYYSDQRMDLKFKTGWRIEIVSPPAEHHGILTRDNENRENVTCRCGEVFNDYSKGARYLHGLHRKKAEAAA
jgi:hypothetical protein